LHFHPLSSFCMKALIGLYEPYVPFAKNAVDLSNEAHRAALMRLWPIAKFPVLRDDGRDATVVESTIILEYLDHHYARGDERAEAEGASLRATRPFPRADEKARLVPRDPDLARECRFRDRVFDLYVNTPLGKIVVDKLRPEGQRDPLGVEEAKSQITTAYGIAERWLTTTGALGSGGPWALGETFTMADCAAAPALFYASRVVPFGSDQKGLAAYHARLMERSSFARVIDESKPFQHMFPG